MQNQEAKKLFNLFVIIIVSAILGSYAIMQIKWYADYLRTGRQSQPYPRQYGSPLPVPNTNPASPAAKPLGADFSQVYFASLALRHGESGYTPVTPFYQDRFGRPPGYPPFTNWVYQILAHFSYPTALLIHTMAVIIIFILAFYLFTRRLALWSYFWPILGVFIVLYFYTPIGLFHLERGQFELYVAAAFLLFMLCLITERGGFAIAILCGILASLKWSSLPFLSTFGILVFLVSGACERKKLLTIAAVMVMLMALFPSQLLEYLQVIRHYELETEEPLGYSFLYLLPVAMAKAIPLVTMIILAALLLRLSGGARKSRFHAASLPMALALALQGIGFGTLVNEYHALDLLAFLPVLPFWLERASVPFKHKRWVVILFALLLVFLFRAPNILFWLQLDIRLVQPMLLSGIILLTSLLFLGWAAFILARPLGGGSGQA